jgi:DNA-binding CsgD family transcriptional regulator
MPSFPCQICLTRVCSHVAREVHLSPRQRDMVRCLTRGLSNKEIAWELGIKVHTCAGYLTILFDLLGLTSRLEVALWGVAHQDFLSYPALSRFSRTSRK